MDKKLITPEGGLLIVAIILMLILICCGCIAHQTPMIIEPLPYGKEMLICPKGTDIGSVKTQEEGIWMSLKMWERIVMKMEKMQHEKPERYL